MLRIRVLSSLGFRMTLLYAVVVGVAALLAFTVGARMANSQITKEIDESLADRATQLLALGGSDEIAASIVRRTSEVVTARAYFYLLQDADGRVVAGNIPPMPPHAGYIDLPLPDVAVLRKEDDRDDHSLRGLGIVLAGGSYFVVARDIYDFNVTKEMIFDTYAGGLLVTLFIALLGAGLISSIFMRRLKAIERTSTEIMAGNLSERIPLRGGNNEFDRLSAHLNGMLDLIEMLMSNLRQVTDDIAHDLRTPLTRLRQRLERTRLHAANLTDYETTVDQAIRETDSLLETFSALLRIAEIQSGARRGRFGPVDLSALTLTIVETFVPVAEDQGRPFDSDVAPGIWVRGDHDLLCQLLANLVQNTLTHTPAGSGIGVSLAPSAMDGEAHLMVADSGPGIPAAERQKVFQRFYRMDSSRSTPGSGLGLSLVAAIADLHGMRVSLHDNGPGVRVDIHFSRSSCGNGGGPNA